MDFTKIVPYLEDPLVLIGFVIFLGFLFSRYLIKRGVIPDLPPHLGYRILKQLLLYGFVIGLLVIVLGFGLRYRELSKSEQFNAFKMLKSELSHNLRTANELKKNISHILEKQIIIAGVLRKDGIEIFKILFPSENLERNPSRSVRDMVDSSFAQLVAKGMINDELQLNRFKAAGQQVNLTINNTLPVLTSLQDKDGKRYTIKSEVWESNLSIYRKVNRFDVTIFQGSLTELERLRTNYDVVFEHAIDYLITVKDFFKAGNSIGEPELYKALFKERLSFEMTILYSGEIIKSVENLVSIQKTLGVDSTVVKK
ncbi:MAG: hypothetical protein OXG87_22670 [Gemmatimonadetes bacterium]|nr:hypothetical protein [Gemmatimonadota bacterium]